MYDFWFALGVGVIDPTLLNAIDAAKPDFSFSERITTEIIDGELVAHPKAPSTGRLKHGPTTAVRAAIHEFVKNFSSAAPPIGIYCAGKFCQLVKIPLFNPSTPESTFKDIIELAHIGYQKAIASGLNITSPMFAAFLGACMLDGNLAIEMKKPVPTAALKEVASEFGIAVDPVNPDWAIVKAFVDTDEFRVATTLLMGGGSNPWEGGACGDQVFFWDDFNERAIA